MMKNMIDNIWDLKWSKVDVAQFIKESFESDLWTIHHKPIIDEYLKTIDKNAVFLEAGCGMGQWCFYAAENYKVRALGIDIAGQTIHRLKNFCKDQKIDLVNFVIDDLNDTKLSDNCCDMFVSLG